MRDSLKQRLPVALIDFGRAVRSGYRQITGPWRVLPRILIIGTQRGGTTSLYSYLVRHPHVGESLYKEVNYFDINYGRGTNWYRSHFPFRSRGVLGIDATPYYMQHPLACERAHRLLPDAKMIALLRNPADRAFSQHHKNRRRGREELPFREALEREEERVRGEVEKIQCDPSYNSFAHRQLAYRSKGIYEAQLRPWLETFPKESLLVLKSEDMYEDPARVYQRVIEFLELPPFELDFFPAMNQFAKTSTFDDALREELLEFYRPHNERLYELLGIDFGWN
jgi:hypothetical protein